MSAFDNATLMITGGTGSFGSTVLKHFLDSDLKEIRIFSRDEKKQDDMRHKVNVADETFVDKIFTENTIDAVIHFAGFKAFWRVCAKTDRVLSQ